jgi:hypothetical protein
VGTWGSPFLDEKTGGVAYRRHYYLNSQTAKKRLRGFTL